MSTNISHIRTLRSSLVLPSKNFAEAFAMKDEMPSCNPLPRPKTVYCHQHGRFRRSPEAPCTCPSKKEPVDIQILDLQWCGDFSGCTWVLPNRGTSLFAKFVALLEGEGDFIVIWEGGAYVTGLKIRDGKATECGVKFELVDAT